MDTLASTLSSAFSNLQEFYHQSAQKLGYVERFYTIAGYTIHLCFAGTALLPAITNALAHLATAPTVTPDLTIYLADSASSGIEMPLPTVAPGMYRLEEEGLYFCHYGEGLWQEVFAPHLQLGIFAIDTASDYPGYASPLRNILLWWLAQHELYGLHAAAVGTQDSAALIVGNSGSGKSTTAITCLQAGLTYLGDDFCIVKAADRLQVYSLYSSGKLCDDSRRRLAPHATTEVHIDDHHKMVYQWHPHFKAQLPSSLPIQAILLPTFSGGTQTSVHPATTSEAFTALVTTTLRVTSLPTRIVQNLLTAMKCLAQQTPCYHLALGTETGQIAATITRLLQEQPRS